MPSSTPNTLTPNTRLQPVSLWRVLAAIGYDSLLLLATWMLATALLLPLTGGRSLTAYDFSYQLGYQLYLLVISFWFFAWFWRHGGQTLGMLAWRIQLCQQDGSPASWRQIIFRFMAAIISWLALGLGFFWIIIDPENRSWHDRISQTQLRLLPKPLKTKH